MTQSPFPAVAAQPDLAAQEHRTLDFWRERSIFSKLRAQNADHEHWSFVDGPITANNPMGVHHAWGRTYKDAFNRYHAMLGQELRFQQGFDCQGLWVEVNVERELGFTSKKDIETFGIAEFVRLCKQRVLTYAAVQTEQSIRLGYWMDWNDPDELRHLRDLLEQDPSQVVTVEGPDGPVTDTVEMIVGQLGMPELGGSYFTFANENNYMIWRFLKTCWEKGWLYRGADVMPWCSRCATAISQHEIVTDGYEELTHQAVTLRFPLRERPGESLLVWTTTPWTLTSNVAAAVGAELTYVKVQTEAGIVYLSKGCLAMLEGKIEVLAELKGAEMEGWTYDGPFDDLPAEQLPGGYTHIESLKLDVPQSAVEAHRVILWEEVGEEEGTGIVHIAPGCGAEDFQLGKEYGLPMVAPLDEEGIFIEQFDWLTGRSVLEVSDAIFDNLREKGILYHVRPITHRYPVCWRCKTPLVFRLVDEWFISMDELRFKMMDVTKQIRWIPSFGMERELDWLRNMHDWMISKKRYWGLALPFWVCDDCGEHIVIGDDDELKERAIAGWETFAGHTPHRPFIDAVKVACPHCGGSMTRITDVGNPWLDAGIVPFSTLRYRSDRAYWEEWFPADWISESFPGQFRNWFYSVLAMGTVLAERPPFLENFGYATLWAEDGRPMHKSWGNMIEFNEAADKMGVDVMRWLYCAHKPETNLIFGYAGADEVRRLFLIPLWNVYKFLVGYANLDGWQPETAGFDPANPEGQAPASDNPLDRWIVARVNQVVASCTQNLTDSDAYTATGSIEALLDDLTNWYVRRSRRRFWKSEHDADKGTAYATLYYVFVRMLKMLAPIVPFVTEVMYQNLVREVQPEARESVHHCDWPVADEATIDQTLLQEMALARRVASLGLAARSSANLKVRQPLSKALIHDDDPDAKLSPALVDIVADELNVKAVAFVAEEGALVSYQLLPDAKVLGPRLGRLFPKVRGALAQGDARAIVHQAQAGETVTLEVEGETVELAPDEILIQTQPAEGLAVAAEKGVTVAVDAVLTPELQQEGLVRDLVRYVQTLRRTADFAMDDRIVVGLFDLDDAAKAALSAFEGYFKQETLCLDLLLSDDGTDWAARDGFKLAGQAVEGAVRKA